LEITDLMAINSNFSNDESVLSPYSIMPK